MQDLSKKLPTEWGGGSKKLVNGDDCVLGVMGFSYDLMPEKDL